MRSAPRAAMMWAPRICSPPGVAMSLIKPTWLLAMMERSMSGGEKRLIWWSIPSLEYLSLGHADVADLRVGEDAIGHGRGIDFARFAKDGVAEGGAALLGGDVGELHATGYVAGGPDVRRRGAELLVDGDPAALCVDTNRFQVEVGGLGHAASGDEYFVDVDAERVALMGQQQRPGAVLIAADIFDLGGGVDVYAVPVQDALQHVGDLFVFGRHDLGQHLEQCHLGSEAGEDLGELGADRSGADDGEAGRQGAELEDRFVGERRRFCQSRDGGDAGFGAGCNGDLVELDALAIGVELVRADEAGGGAEMR